jgi:hypothetical protein
MKQRHKAQSEYLPPEYNEALEPLESVLEALEFPPPDVSVRQIIRQQMGSMASTQFSFQKFATKESKSIPKQAKSIGEFDTYLRFSALKVIGKDLMYRHTIQTIASAASEAVIEGDTEASEHARNIAETIIDHRAVSTAYSLLDAHNLTYMVFDEKEDSVWDRSVAAHERHPKVKPPAYIGDREGEDFWAILQRQKESTLNSSKPDFKPSRSKLLTGIRLAKAMKEPGPVALESDPIALHIKSIGEIVTKILVVNQPSFEITPSEIVRSMQTALKARRYMDSAAMVDVFVRADPTYAYVSYLGGQLVGYDSRSELAVFDRDVRRKAKNNK